MKILLYSPDAIPKDIPDYRFQSNYWHFSCGKPLNCPERARILTVFGDFLHLDPAGRGQLKKGEREKKKKRKKRKKEKPNQTSLAV